MLCFHVDQMIGRVIASISGDGCIAQTEEGCGYFTRIPLLFAMVGGCVLDVDDGAACQEAERSGMDVVRRLLSAAVGLGARTSGWT